MCEICQEGRIKLRPVLVQVERKKLIFYVLNDLIFQEEECDDSSTQEFCSEGIEDSSKWTKTCSVPPFLQEEVLKEVLENTQDRFNEISDNENEEPNQNIQESKIIRMKLPVRFARKGNDSISTIEGADIFFAKQFFQHDLVRRGPSEDEVIIHTNKVENNGDEKNHHSIDIPFKLAKETDEPKIDMKVNFKFDVPSPSIRPTGVPYVYSDTANIRFASRPTPSGVDTLHTRFAKRPTPQTVTEPSSTTNKFDKFDKSKEISAGDSSDIDSLIDLIISDKDFNIELPLPTNIQPTETYNLLNPKIETLNNQVRNNQEPSSDPTPRFPFLEWQDNSSVFNTQGFKGDDLRNTNIDSRIQDNFSTISRSSEERYDNEPISASEGYVLDGQDVKIASRVPGDLKLTSTSEATGLHMNGSQSQNVLFDNFHRIQGSTSDITKNVKSANGHFDTNTQHSNGYKSFGLQGSLARSTENANNNDDRYSSNSQRYKNPNLFEPISDHKSVNSFSSGQPSLDILKFRRQNGTTESPFMVAESLENPKRKSSTNSLEETLL